MSPVRPVPLAVVFGFLLLSLSPRVSAGDSALSVVPSSGHEDDSAAFVASESEADGELPYSGEPFIATNEWQVVKPGEYFGFIALVYACSDIRLRETPRGSRQCPFFSITSRRCTVAYVRNIGNSILYADFSVIVLWSF